MIKILFLLLAINFILSPSGQTFAQEENEVSELFAQANQHFTKGEYKEALERYDAILELVPNNISTLKINKTIQHTGMTFAQRPRTQ